MVLKNSIYERFLPLSSPLLSHSPLFSSSVFSQYGSSLPACLRETPPGPGPPDYMEALRSINQQLTSLTPHSHWPTWACMSPLRSQLYSASSVLEWNRKRHHLNPLRNSEGERKPLAGLWACEHIYLSMIEFSLQQMLAKSCWHCCDGSNQYHSAEGMVQTTFRA